MAEQSIELIKNGGGSTSEELITLDFPNQTISVTSQAGALYYGTATLDITSLGLTSAPKIYGMAFQGNNAAIMSISSTSKTQIVLSLYRVASTTLTGDIHIIIKK